MSGKSYTMKEMKAIVDYLIQQRAYGEFKGRKMWIDYANSNLTTRTWQSLKETFLKRILPDIRNPYYKLTVQQIESFQQGHDLESRINNKLEIRTVDEDNMSSDANHKDPQLPGPSSVKDPENDAGEVQKCSKITENRSSTETIVTEPCYKTAEEIQMALESPKNGNNENKTIRDYITYAEPLTPMIQEMLNDFASDDEGSDKEPQMQIVEDTESNNRKDDSDLPAESLIEKSNQIETNKNIGAHNKGDTETHKEDTQTHKEDTENNIQDTETNKQLDKPNSETECIDISDDESNDVPNAKQNSQINVDISNIPSVAVTTDNIQNINVSHMNLDTQNSNTTVDTLLPNNQEELGNVAVADDNTQSKPSTSEKHSITKTVNKRKRAKSQETNNVNPKKRHVDNEKQKQSSSDLDTRIKNNEEVMKSINRGPEKSGPEKIDNPQSKDEQSNGKVSNKGNIPSVQGSHTSINKSTTVGDEILPDNNLSENTSKPQNINPNVMLPEKSVMPDTSKTEGKDKGHPKKISREVIQLSHSDSDRDIIISPKKEVPLHQTKSYRDGALGKVFGFAHGGATKSRRKSIISRMRSSLHRRNSSLSSEYTSDTGSEYISPPRGRKNRQTRKYLRPKSARVLCLEEEGGLFVMHGKRIYPVVKDGKIIKNYLTYTPADDSDNEDSFWKSKYVEEKKKTEELKKLLQNKEQKEITPALPAPPIPLNPSRASTSKDLPEEKKQVPVLNVEEETKSKEETKVETVKIKFTKNNEEVQLEGHWSHINPVLAQVVQIFHKNADAEANNAIQIATERTDKVANCEAPIQTPVNNSENVSPVMPVDVEVHEKVTELENKIFREIEEREEEDTNVTKRKTGKPDISSASPVSQKKKPRMPSEENETPSTNATTAAKEQNNNTNIVTAVKRQTKTPKNILNDNIDENKIKENQITKRKTRNSSRSSTVEVTDNPEVRYKFRSPRTSNIQPETKIVPVKTGQKSKKTNAIPTAGIFSSPDNCMYNSIESTQGYQDSEDSNLGICLRKKRRLSLSVLNKGRNKTQRSIRRKPRLNISNDPSSDSSHSFVTAPLKSSSDQNSSLNTDVYRSESYQMLFTQGKCSFQHLEKIDETSPTTKEAILLNVEKSDVASNSHSGKSSLEINIVDNFSLSSANDGEHSSNVTLPPSPILSIVENLSVSKNVLNSTDDLPLNKDEINNYSNVDVDMSLPLMEQEGNLYKSAHNESESHFKFNVPEISSQVSDSFLTKICAVNLKEPSLSDSLHQKLRNLFLESAKKFVSRNNKNESDDEEKTSEPIIPKNARPKKRCSTPRKKQNKRKFEPCNVEKPLIEEEHIESCASKSCPPIIVTELIDDNAIGISPNVNKTRTIKKKDVIKVKILKPKAKQKANDINNMTKQGNKSLLQTDSGINDTESGVFLLGMDDSVDLIHNHSDTCLNANECMNNSVEIIHNNEMSVISLNSSQVEWPLVETEQVLKYAQENRSLDIFCGNAQDANNIKTATNIAYKKDQARKSETVFFTPATRVCSLNSLLTDDLSDECPVQSEDRVSAWYLLSEDEISNTNNLDIPSQFPNYTAGCGANLQQIFPITCAVPDLSTITEENTRKFTIEGDTRNEFDTQSLPNVN